MKDSNSRDTENKSGELSEFPADYPKKFLTVVQERDPYRIYLDLSITGSLDN